MIFKPDVRFFFAQIAPMMIAPIPATATEASTPITISSIAIAQDYVMQFIHSLYNIIPYYTAPVDASVSKQRKHLVSTQKHFLKHYLFHFQFLQHL